ncbi:MAG: hypothetical protein LUC88_07975 [Prevotella sp.]|nr:hypothetical protein [Prevotella sp.]
MRRIRDRGENETEENARQAWYSYSNHKGKRSDIQRFEKKLDRKLDEIAGEIAQETFKPCPYTPKDIFTYKHRQLAKTSVHDHALETAAIFPYQQQIYDKISWRSPAVRPGLGTHAFMRMLRNDLFRSMQKECMYNVTLDAHHYFPLMCHDILSSQLDRFVKPGKLRRHLQKVVDSYPQGVPLGIKTAQLFGMIYLSKFDREAEKFFGIAEDSEKLAYWKSRYIDMVTATAITPDDYRLLAMGSAYLGMRFERFAREGLRHYYRFVDNIVIMHEDRCFLHIANEVTVMILARDYRVTVNKEWNVRPTWTGIRICGYVFYHEKVMLGRRNKKGLCRAAHKLKKKGTEEEKMRIKLSSRIGFAIHADSTNLLKTIGMEKTLGKIIRKRRITPPFAGMTPEQKVKFSSICAFIVNDGKNPPPENPIRGLRNQGFED